MARQRKEKPVKGIKLEHPDRSAPGKGTLVDFAKQRNLFEEADRRQRQLDNNEVALSPGAERFLETVLWTATLATVHFTFDVLVQRQYGMEVLWHQIVTRTLTAWLVFVALFYVLHPHYANPTFIPFLPKQYQERVRQAIFFVMSVTSGCYLIHISNNYGYLAVMKRAPPVGCLWLWAVVEMDLLWAVPSLLIAIGYAWKNGYGFK
ncbi:deacetylase [Fusarium albosuccineum]|uniref:Deacetylase n=1 Tax=Fusarium albosuccineum TaxID=1237068 RepID=A0A8H4L620_9HYPO|nr:deacetylase [Fusarium albosuccineum]